MPNWSTNQRHCFDCLVALIWNPVCNESSHDFWLKMFAQQSKAGRVAVKTGNKTKTTTKNRQRNTGETTIGAKQFTWLFLMSVEKNPMFLFYLLGVPEGSKDLS